MRQLLLLVAAAINGLSATTAAAPYYYQSSAAAPTAQQRQLAATDCPGVTAGGTSPSAAGLEACINNCLNSSETCAGVTIPAGDYLLERTLKLNAATRPGGFTLRGEGKGTVLLWPADSDLLVFVGGVGQLTFSSLALVSTGKKSPNSTALRFTDSLTRSLIADVEIMSDGPAHTVGSGINMGVLTDSCTIRETQIWGISGTGITIGHGSQVIIKGGRVIGNGPTPRGTSIGVHVTGNNGGVHVAQTDLIQHLEAMRMDSSSGAGSNREIFIAQATFDSSWRGLAIYDNSYVDIAGCWAASSEDANIYVSPNSSNALLSISGGTIFNACAEQPNKTESNASCYGMVVHAGSFAISAVAIRDNKGVGLWVGEDVVGASITGCKVQANSIGAVLNGEDFTFVGNVVAGNRQAQLVVGEGAKGGRISANVGAPDHDCTR